MLWKGGDIVKPKQEGWVLWQTEIAVHCGGIEPRAIDRVTELGDCLRTPSCTNTPEVSEPCVYG